MPIVDIKKLKEAEAALIAATPKIEKVEIGGKVYFKGPQTDDYFDDYGECVSANEAIVRKARLAKLGLNEYGQTPEQVENAKEIAKLLEQKQKLIDQEIAIDQKIAALSKGIREKEVKEEKEEKPKKYKKG